MNLASPGNYFGSKSCKFGFLDGVGKVNDRPFFDTPKKTNRGDIIDHLSTPFYERDVSILLSTLFLFVKVHHNK